MDHKERCKRLKAIRKKIADTIGLDLHQKECTFEGECKGTCAKCQQEEKLLNTALLGGTVAAASVMLSACGMEKQPSANYETGKNGIVKNYVENTFDQLKDGSIEDIDPINGDLVIENEPSNNEIGGEAYLPENDLIDDEDSYEYQLTGDEYFEPSDSYFSDLCEKEENIITLCKNYSMAEYVEFVEEVDSVKTYICYNLEEDEDGNEVKEILDTIYVDCEQKRVYDAYYSNIDISMYLY